MPTATILQKKFFVQTASSATVSITPSSSLTSGSVLWAVCWGSADMSAATISDGTNTYTAQGSDGYSAIWLRHWVVTSNASTGTPTVTVTPASNRSMTIALVEVGSVAASPVDSAATNWQNWDSSSFPAQRPVLSATTQADEIILGAIATSPGLSQSRTYGANTGWTLETQSTTGPSYALISKTVTSIATYTPDWTMAADGSTQVVFAGLAIKAGTNGQGSSFIPRRMMLGVG